MTPDPLAPRTTGPALLPAATRIQGWTSDALARPVFGPACETTMLVTNEPEREIAERIVAIRHRWRDALEAGDTRTVSACRQRSDELLDHGGYGCTNTPWTVVTAGGEGFSLSVSPPDVWRVGGERQ